MVEAEQARAVEPFLERLQERSPLLHRERNAFGAQAVEQIEEDALLVISRSKVGPPLEVFAALLIVA
jgi:hypothetical protein